METLPYTNKTYSHKKVTISQAVKLLKKNGIPTTEDQAVLILNFLYLLARAYKKTEQMESGFNHRKEN